MVNLNTELLDSLPYGTKIEIKDGWFWKLLGFLVKVFTFGSNKLFMTNYITTIGNRIAMPVSIWDMRNTDPVSFYQVLCHELTHVKQFHDYGLGNVWLGAIVQSFLYLLLPLPMGFAYFRYKFESEAYVEGFKAVWRWFLQSGEATKIEDFRSECVQNTYNHLTSGDYGYTMAFCKSWVNKDLVKRFYAVKLTDVTG